MTITFPIESGHVQAFSRALAEPECERGLCPEGALIPPTFLAAVALFDSDYPNRPRPGQSEAVATTDEAGGRALHAEQRYEYRRPVVVGDVLTARRAPGRTWEKASSRGGLLVFDEEVTRFADARGELVCTATPGAGHDEPSGGLPVRLAALGPGTRTRRSSCRG